MTYYPEWVCAKCGKQFGRKACGIATWHHGTCGVCLADAEVTELRDFGHLRDDWKVRYWQAHNSEVTGPITGANKGDEA